MKIVAATFSSLLATTASANPFAPQTTQNTAKANYIGSLMRGARPTAKSQLRRLEEEADVDISGYSIKFEQCQLVKQYAGVNGNNNNNNNNNNGEDSILATKRFVIFRLCPENSCSSCNSNYGEYIVDMDTYLESTLRFKQEQQEQYCQACEECAADGNDDDGNDAAARRRRRHLAYDNLNCNTCYDECKNIENMEVNGYVDASEYINCQKVYENENTGKVYYAGAMCSGSGTRIKIALFADEQCSLYDGSVDADQHIKNNNGYNVKLSYHLLKQTFPDYDCVASCAQVDENDAGGNDDGGNGDQAQQVEVAEVCQDLYEAAGKCEQVHGFVDGMKNYEAYDNQAAQEEEVCDFITMIKSGSYDQTGEIVVTAGRSVLSGKAKTTGGQKFALTFFVIGTVGLSAYAFLLHQQLTKGSGHTLSEQGGAMA
mmetsp:Transcript_10439/g.22422  ORF Transcript_10439/g.22422 Transcript_10439/m.22422 type:complete len:429 (+) Transcript_10439:188-1474(+)